jgi:hypothetical protein
MNLHDIARIHAAPSVRRMKKTILLLSILVSSTAYADPKPPPPPYSLAWQLRPAAAATVVRSDTAVAMYGTGSTVASTFLASYKVTPVLAPLFRIAVSHDSPDMGEGSNSLSNLLIGTTWTPPVLKAPFKFAAFGAVTLPVGSGAVANKSSVLARSGMDNALFAINDMAVIAGADLAYVRGGFTVQGEMTLFQLARVRNAEMQPDKAKTNMTSGLHAGWFPIKQLSIGAELRYQRYLSTPSFVADAPAARDCLSAAVGVRVHLKLGGGRWARPGVAYARGLDDPMNGRGYDVVQLDLPVSF